MEDQNFYTKADLAKKFKKTEQTIHNWIKAGRLWTVKVEGSVLIPESAVQDMLAANVQQPTGLTREARAAITELVAAAPTLTPEKVAQLRHILNDTTSAVA
ncbi:helix-turn-helix domain-containing protein [Micromonospora zamorensis]|uniref:helix-turn-helix domain-containing protein n=1 Tax=Micromonospora zamorensis TaxID=709883 RepID=UPI00081FC0BF|nr:helix-turn-helix domain-containing protein [Micromonospora zamorensis]SCG38141.1 Helix-turn-helix domain-containing protein [Micromonospora zamorensis]